MKAGVKSRGLVVLGAALVAASLALLGYAAYALLASPRALPADHGPAPTDEQLRAVEGPRAYDVPPGAVLTLTVPAIGIRDAPVFEGDGFRALNSGVGHVPETSMPWTDAPQRNVYLAGHRHGWPGTRGRLIFYELDELEKGDGVVLEDDRGRTYEYEAAETFVVEPEDSWVMAQVRGRDMATLQTCTLPDLDRRLIVRADRV